MTGKERRKRGADFVLRRHKTEGKEREEREEKIYK
jgi:hypothetical protein